MKIWTALLACWLVMASVDAQTSRRLGGGASPSPAAPAATPAAATAPRTAAPAAAAAVPAAAKGPWGAMLGGLATGLGLAWLADSLGLGDEVAQFMLFALLALVIIGAVGLVIRARRSSVDAYSLQGIGASADFARAPRQYSPDKVGNDASARPWEQPSAAFVPSPAHWSAPPGFDASGFVEAAKRNFIALQDAWDRSDIEALRAMMTDEMVGEIRSQLAEREAHRGVGPNQTDVVMLHAQLLGVEDLGEGYLASVEFSGMIREELSAGPGPFREVWNMTKPKSGTTGWLVAGVQALQ